MSRVSVWIDGERRTADREEFWAAVERVGDPLDSPDEFLAVLDDLSPET